MKGTVTMGHAGAPGVPRRRPARAGLPEDRTEAGAAGGDLLGRGAEKLLAVEVSEEAKILPPKAGAKAKSADVKALEDQLRTVLGTKVEIKPGRGRKGKIQLEYYSVEDFNRLFKRLMR